MFRRTLIILFLFTFCLGCTQYTMTNSGYIDTSEKITVPKFENMPVSDYSFSNSLSSNISIESSSSYMPRIYEMPTLTSGFSFGVTFYKWNYWDDGYYDNPEWTAYFDYDISPGGSWSTYLGQMTNLCTQFPFTIEDSNYQSYADTFCNNILSCYSTDLTGKIGYLSSVNVIYDYYWWGQYNVIYTFYDLCTPSFTPAAGYNDEGYIAPKVVKYIDSSTKNTVYKMWLTEYHKEYLLSSQYKTSGYKTYNYVYSVKCFTSADGETWNAETDTSFYDCFNTDTGGGIILSDIKSIGDGGSNTIYYAMYLKKTSISSTDTGWKLYTAYAVNSPKDWIVKSGSNYIMTLESSSSGFDSYNVGIASLNIGSTGEYNLWYSGSTKTKSSIGHAVGSDALSTWNKSAGNPVFSGTTDMFDAKGATDPCVIKDGSVYKMYYSGYDGASYYIGLAYSYDGETFVYYDTTKYKPVISSDVSVRYPYVLDDTDSSGKSIKRIYYCKRDSVPGYYYPHDTTSGYVSASSNTYIWNIYMAKTDAY
jgi:hypothetical protein